MDGLPKYIGQRCKVIGIPEKLWLCWYALSLFRDPGLVCSVDETSDDRYPGSPLGKEVKSILYGFDFSIATTINILSTLATSAEKTHRQSTATKLHN